VKPGAVPRILAVLASILVTVSLRGREDRPGPAAKGNPPRTIQDIVRLLDRIAPDPSRAQRLRARMSQAIPETPDLAVRAKAYWDRARAAQEAGAVQRQITDLRRAWELGSAGDPDRVQSELAVAEWQGGNALTALRMLEGLRHAGRPGFETAHGAILARVQVSLGDLPAAKEMLAFAQSRLLDAKWRRSAALMLPNWRANVGFAQGKVLDAEGRLQEAESAYREAMADNARALDTERSGQNAAFDAPSAETLASRGESIHLGLALNLMRQGRLGEAELAVREILQRSLARNGRDSLNTGQVVTAFGRILYEGGRFAEAEILGREAVESLEKAGVVPEALSLARARWMRAEALVSLSRDGEACAEFEKARAGLKGGGPSPVLVREEAPWALALIRTGQCEAALRLLEPMIQASRSQVGDTHSQTAEWRGFEALARARLGQREAALRAFREVAPTLFSGPRAGGDAQAGTPGRTQRRTWIVEGYIDLLSRLHEAGQDAGASPDLSAEALRLADWARGGKVQNAVAASATRAAIKDPRMAGRVRREQDLKTQVEALYQLLGDALSAPPDQQSTAAVADLRRVVARLSSERTAINAGLLKSFPGFASLVDPSPATLEETRAALAEDEAFLSVLVTGERSFIWAWRKRGPLAFTPSPLGERELGPLVSRLRQALDPGQIRLRTLPSFDLAAAYGLYEHILAPVAEGWRGAGTLVACVNGSLGQLPLSVLPTRPWTEASGSVPFAEYRDAPWLIRTCAVFQVPSMESFVRLRNLGPGRTGRRAFLGFGDPQFSREEGPRPPGQASGPGLRNLAILAGSGSPPVPGGSQATPEEWVQYERIPPLPETRGEILAIADVLGADPLKDVFLGKAASKKTLFALPLDQWRIIAFSTHGLIPGEFPGLGEPALALAAPEDRSESGFLVLDEILGLKLDADWVVLSACNTAAGDGLGAEAVSGLGRAFFYAGSRALLVTHWAVETVSARDLVTGVFRHRMGKAGLSRAESLRQAMLEVMAGQYLDPVTRQPVFAYAHPLFWAPYALVGDGGRTSEP
jgi:CHAT domain-containing protein